MCVYARACVCTSTAKSCQCAVCFFPRSLSTSPPTSPHPGLQQWSWPASTPSLSVPVTKGMSSTGEDELEDVLSDVDEVPKSKKKKKAKKSSRESRSSKRQRPVREVSLLFVTLLLLLFAFYFASRRHFFNCPGGCWNTSLNKHNRIQIIPQQTYWFQHIYKA